MSLRLTLKLPYSVDDLDLLTFLSSCLHAPSAKIVYGPALLYSEICRKKNEVGFYTFSAGLELDVQVRKTFSV